MSKLRFTEEEMLLIQSNKNIVKCSDKAVTYSKKFKVECVKKYLEGWGPIQIFQVAGMPINLIGRDKPKECIRRWVKKYRVGNEQSLLTETRGQGMKGRKKVTIHNPAVTLEEKLKLAEARIAYLECENEFIKKLNELEGM